MVKWVALLLGVVALAVFGWMVNDLRVQAKRAAVTVNDKLPEILEKTRKSTETLAVLSEDIRQLRDLAGASDVRDRSLAGYADAILDAVESSGGSIGTKGLLGGDKLKDPQPAGGWAAAARKEAVWLTFRAKSRDDLLARLTQTKFGSEWFIQSGADAPLSLRDWIELNVTLPTTQPAGEAKAPVGMRSLPHHGDPAVRLARRGSPRASGSRKRQRLGGFPRVVQPEGRGAGCDKPPAIG